MPILENTTDFAEDGQVTHTNLNALTESAKFVKAGSGVANSGNTTDEATLDVNGSGELIIATADGTKGIKAAQINSDAVTEAKIIDGAVTEDKIGALAVTAGKIGALAVTEAKIGANAVSEGKIKTTMISGHAETTAAPADDDELLISDTSAGANKRIDVSDLFKHPSLPRAYGTVTWDTSAATSYGSGISSVASTSANVRTVTLSAAMADTNYTVTATMGGTVTSNGIIPIIDITSSTVFTITHSLEEATKVAHFSVFGTLA